MCTINVRWCLSMKIIVTLETYIPCTIAMIHFAAIIIIDITYIFNVTFTDTLKDALESISFHCQQLNEYLIDWHIF